MTNWEICINKREVRKVKWKVLFAILGLVTTMALAQKPLLKKGDKAIPFTLPTLNDEVVSMELVGGKLVVNLVKDVGGKKVKKTLHPKVVIIDFWATW